MTQISQMSIFLSMDQVYADSPSIDQIYANDNIAKFLNEMVGYISQGSIDCPPHLIRKYYRFFTILTLKSTLFNAVENIIIRNNHDKMSSALSIVVSTILPILKNSRDREDPDIREHVTDFFAHLMDQANQFLVKAFKREISEIFYSDNFFCVNRRTLRKWSTIINHFIID